MQVRTLLAARGIVLDVTVAARDLLGNWGYDPAFGARPLKRVIRRELEDRIAKQLLQGEVGEGAHVVVDASGEELSLEVSGATAA